MPQQAVANLKIDEYYITRTTILINVEKIKSHIALIIVIVLMNDLAAILDQNLDYYFNCVNMAGNERYLEGNE